ncbi:MAG TPA: DUF4388 domain-containing protein [Mycobacteriales bacterium]|nr:DUF4388 domain-containing protein [Mycobacteriales bacterium]
MLKGDLSSTPLAPLLVQLAEEDSTGCLHISDAEGDEALIYYKGGLVYAVSVPGQRPQLGAKLISSGALAPEALADALEAQRTELQGWRLGELLVHLGYVDQPVVEDFIREQVHDALWDLIKWVDGRWKFRKSEKTREDVAPPMSVADLLADLRERGYEWQTISSVVHGPTAVPVLSARGGGEPETTLDADAWSMLCKIDGERTVAELARDCGYTLFEAGQVLVALVTAGLVDIDEDLELAPESSAADGDDDVLYGATPVRSALAADAASAADEIVGDDSFAALARLVTEVAATVREEPAAPAVELPSPVRFNGGNDQSFAASIERVSQALSDVLGPPSQTHDPFEVPAELRIRKQKSPEQRALISDDEARKMRARQAAAAELAAAHALAEALRASQTPPPQLELVTDLAEVAPVADLAAVRREAELARLEEEQRAAEQAARVEAERIAAEEEAARLEAERLAAEEAARLEAAKEAARIAAEEEAAHLEAERLAAEEAARVAAEEEAARLEAERLAEEEAARVAAEEEAARLAAEEEAARLAAEEATRLAAEDAARVAAEEAARLEGERLAAEEATRIAAEEELARMAAERLASERADAENEAWAEYWAREARAAEVTSQREAAASALLTQLSAEPVSMEPVVEDEPEVEDPAPVREPAAVGARTAPAMNEMADTAALLRELSSLGLEDEPSPPSSPSSPRPPAPRPSRPAASEKKKKRGLFGF